MVSAVHLAAFPHVASHCTATATATDVIIIATTTATISTLGQCDVDPNTTCEQNAIEEHM